MKISSILFPYPVLSESNDDYIGSTFNAKYEIVNNGINTRSLLITYELHDEKLEYMIKNGEVDIIVHIECPRTTYRKKIVVKNKYIEVDIDEQQMRNNIEVNNFLILNKNIDKYSNKNFNELYYGHEFLVEHLVKGSILGLTNTQEIRIENDENDFEDLPSIMKVAKSKARFMEVNMDGDIILINLPEKEYDNYFRLSNTNFTNLIMTSTIFPCLVYVLDKIGKMSEDSEDLIWYKSIVAKISQINIRIEDINQSVSSLKIAQMILENPLDRAFNEVNREIEKENY